MKKTLFKTRSSIVLSIAASFGWMTTSYGNDGCITLSKTKMESVNRVLLDFKTKMETSHPGALLFITPGGNPEYTLLDLPGSGVAPGANVSKIQLDGIKAASQAGKETIVWNLHAGGNTMFVPYGSGAEMSEKFSPRKDCSPRAPRLRSVMPGCNLVNLADFDTGATLLYDSAAEDCKRIGEISMGTDLSNEDQKILSDLHRELAEKFKARTGENRSPSIDAFQTRILDKSDPTLKIGTPVEFPSGRPANTATGLGNKKN